MSNWTERFLDLAELVASWSKDPSTKVGAVIVRPDHTVASLGFNGFPRGVEDSPSRLHNRDVKYPMTIHAEINAIITAAGPVNGCKLYSTLFPCADCAGAIIQAGITEVVAPRSEKTEQRWGESQELATTMFREAGVSWVTVPDEDVFTVTKEEATVENVDIVEKDPPTNSVLFQERLDKLMRENKRALDLLG